MPTPTEAITQPAEAETSDDPPPPPLEELETDATVAEDGTRDTDASKAEDSCLKSGDKHLDGTLSSTVSTALPTTEFASFTQTFSEPNLRSTATTTNSLAGTSGSNFRGTSKKKLVKSMSPFNLKPPYSGPRHPFHGPVDSQGFRRSVVNRAQHGSDWDERHQMSLFTNGRHKNDVRPDNALMPKGNRLLFEREQNKEQLRDHLKTVKNNRLLLASLELPEVKVQTSPISADASPTQMPERHSVQGMMLDRDGDVRTWNDRWPNGMSKFNELMHKSHRGYFVGKSVYTDSPSQQWRRFNDQEDGKGGWKTIHCRKDPIFAPFGH
eukprot:TRINITY_DN55588_c0_g1_i1.p1 TRINITY_DN55588_c0_g1~~TRINITY_DN55588_c0_g1_i1.p1  ORF type:complete len:337 (-),score=52.98 TRINITY_DN55588_c0_g1_i1:218-1189(-)